MVAKPWFEIRDEAEVKLRLEKGQKRLGRGKTEVKPSGPKQTP